MALDFFSTKNNVQEDDIGATLDWDNSLVPGSDGIDSMACAQDALSSGLDACSWAEFTSSGCRCMMACFLLSIKSFKRLYFITINTTFTSITSLTAKWSCFLQSMARRAS